MHPYYIFGSLGCHLECSGSVVGSTSGARQIRRELFWSLLAAPLSVLGVLWGDPRVFWGTGPASAPAAGLRATDASLRLVDNIRLLEQVRGPEQAS